MGTVTSKRRRAYGWLGRRDLRAFNWMFGRDSSLLDRYLVPLGRLADRSRLWMVLAVVIAALGGRQGRRAAVRGLLSIAATSILVNQPAKRLFRRARPTPATLVRARFGREPSSTSFPSGHAASAAAFATGVAQEIPLLGIPLGTAAAGVAASRVYAGVHYPGDVLFGAATGAALSVALRRLWPVAPGEPAQARTVYTKYDATPSADGEGLTFVVNADAGPAIARSPVDAIREALPKATIVEVEEPEDWERGFKQAASAAVVGIAGGDGSVNSAAQVAFENKRPLAVIPAGTLNHLARDLGLDSVEEAVDAIKHGRAAAVDVATIDGKVFLNTASFGSYVELVDAREKLEEKIGKWPAMMVALTRILRSSDPVEVEIDGRRHRLWMIFIGNCEYHPRGFGPSWRERLDDGWLDVRMVDGTQPFARTRLLLAVASGTLGKSRVYDRRLVKEITVRSVDGKPLRLARDGETFEGSAEFKVSKMDRPLPIYVNRL